MKLLMREQQVNLHTAPHAVHLECDVCKKTTTFRVTAEPYSAATYDTVTNCISRLKKCTRDAGKKAAELIARFPTYAKYLDDRFSKIFIKLTSELMTLDTDIVKCSHCGNARVPIPNYVGVFKFDGFDRIKDVSDSLSSEMSKYYTEMRRMFEPIDDYFREQDILLEASLREVNPATYYSDLFNATEFHIDIESGIPSFPEEMPLTGSLASVLGAGIEEFTTDPAGELDIENPPEDTPLTVGPDVIKFLSTPKCLTSDLARLMAGGLGNVTIDNREFRRPVDNMPKVRAAADAIGLKFLPQESEDSPDAFHVECEARIVKGLGVPNNIIKDDPHPNEKSD